MTTTEVRPPRTRAPERSGVRADLLVVAITAVAVGLTVWWGRRLERQGSVILLHGAEPLAGPLRTRFDGMSVAACFLAVAFVIALPWFSQKAGWRTLLAGGAAAQALWSVCLALTDGVHKGLIDRMTPKDEYLHDIHRFSGPIQLLRSFTDHIATPTGQDQWATHVGGHPPGALLTFWGLDRLGLSGGGWAAALCVAGGALSVPATLITIRAVHREATARAVAPFLITIPAVVWIAASADAWFLGVTSWGIALLAVATKRRSDIAAVAGGVLLGYGLYLSYGLVLLAPLALVVARKRALAVGTVGVLAVVGAFTAGGFWWFDGLSRASYRVHVGAAGDRPFHYFVIANLAALAIAVGPAALVGLRRMHRDATAWLIGAAALGIAVADLSGLARGEVERIWLPFMPWILAATAYLPHGHRRAWLAGQLALGIVVQSMVVSLW
ncbi:MAG TPA: hypothetical protein VHC49_00695 [Mycobacteriales bacterium]|nr:hypothetical protein [Mycobacteriales bacterium]